MELVVAEEFPRRFEEKDISKNQHCLDSPLLSRRRWVDFDFDETDDADDDDGDGGYDCYCSVDRRCS